jgi:hypothetical protein
VNREELMSSFVMSMRSPAPQQFARSARKPSYSVCRKCGSMMIEDNRGGIVCINTHSDIGNDFSGNGELSDAQR